MRFSAEQLKALDAALEDMRLEDPNIPAEVLAELSEVEDFAPEAFDYGHYGVLSVDEARKLGLPV